MRRSCASDDTADSVRSRRGILRLQQITSFFTAAAPGLLNRANSVASLSTTRRLTAQPSLIDGAVPLPLCPRVAKCAVNVQLVNVRKITRGHGAIQFGGHTRATNGYLTIVPKFKRAFSRPW